MYGHDEWRRAAELQRNLPMGEPTGNSQVCQAYAMML